MKIKVFQKILNKRLAIPYIRIYLYIMITTITTGRKYFTDEYDAAISFARFYDGDVAYADGGYFIIIPR